MHAMATWGSLQFVKLLVEVRDRRVVQRNGKPGIWLRQGPEDFDDSQGCEIGLVRREFESHEGYLGVRHHRELEWPAQAPKLAWFKNARFRVTLGISARTLIGPALGAGLRESLAAVLGLQFRENRVYPRSSSQ